MSINLNKNIVKVKDKNGNWIDLVAIQGHDGKSAYDISVEHGYEGTEEEFAEALSNIPTKLSQLENDSNYITKSVNNLENYYSKTETYNSGEVDKIVDDLDLKSYAKKEDVPTMLSELENDSEHNTVTEDEKQAWNNKSDFSGNYNDLNNKPTIPSLTSQLTNDSGFLTEHQNLDEYAKKDSIPKSLSELLDDTMHRVVTDYEKSIWNNKSEFDGNYNSLSNKPSIPTKVSELINDSNFIINTVNNLTNYYLKTETYNKNEVNQLVSAIPKFSILPVDELPKENISDTTVYLLKDSEEEGNLYTEYIYVNNKWERLGAQEVDLDGYATEEWVNLQIQSFVTSSDVTQMIISSLVGYAKQSELPTKLSDLSGDATHRLVTDTDKQTWNSKSDFDGDYNSLKNKPSIPSEVTESTVSGWGFTKNTGTYSKPSTGIPKTDLSSSVQSSLGKADTALQSYTEKYTGTYSKPSGGIPKSDLASAIQTSLGKADTALQSYTETDPVFVASVAASIKSTDITNWNAKSDFDGDYNSLKNKPNIPKKTSDLTNDSNYIKKSVSDLVNYYSKSELYTKEEVDQFLGILDEKVENANLKYGNAVFIADSAGNGTNNNNYSYVDIIREMRVFKSVTKLTCGGATIGPYNINGSANGYDAISQVNKNQSSIVNADIIYIQFGANDAQSVASGTIHTGTPNDTSATQTVCGYVKKLIERIYGLNNDVQICFLFISNSLECDIATAEQFIKHNASFAPFKNSYIRAMCEWRGNVIPTVKNFNCMIQYICDIGIPASNMDYITTDHIHFNDYGHKIVANKIISEYGQTYGFVKEDALKIPTYMDETKQIITTTPFDEIIWALASGRTIKITSAEIGSVTEIIGSTYVQMGESEQSSISIRGQVLYNVPNTDIVFLFLYDLRSTGGTTVIKRLSS